MILMLKDHSILYYSFVSWICVLPVQLDSLSPMEITLKTLSFSAPRFAAPEHQTGDDLAETEAGVEGMFSL